MMAPTYIEANLQQRRERLHRLRFHMQRLEEIKGRNAQSSVSQIANESRYSQNSILHSRNASGYSERNFGIELGNKFLIQKLLAISKRKPVGPNVRTGSPQSLNIQQRRKKLEEITAENMKFAQRIVRMSGVVSTKRLERQYQDRERYKQLGSRMRLVEIGKKVQKSLHLPGIRPGRSVSPLPVGKATQSIDKRVSRKPLLRRVATGRPEDGNKEAGNGTLSESPSLPSMSVLQSVNLQPQNSPDLEQSSLIVV